MTESVENLPSVKQLQRMSSDERMEVYEKCVRIQCAMKRDDPLRAAADGRMWAVVGRMWSIVILERLEGRLLTRVVLKTQTKCDHDPEHEVWHASDGPISVCKMKPQHLTNAIRMMVKSVRAAYLNAESQWTPDDFNLWQLDVWDAEAKLELLLRERRRRIRLGIYKSS